MIIIDPRTAVPRCLRIFVSSQPSWTFITYMIIATHFSRRGIWGTHGNSIFSESIAPDFRPTPTDVYYNTSVFYFRTSHCFASQQVSTNYCSTIIKYMHYIYIFLLQLHHHCIRSSSLHLSFDNTTFVVVSIQQILYLTFGSSETGIWEE